MGVQIVDEKSIVIRPSPNGVAAALLSIWLAFWLPAGLFVCRALGAGTMGTSTRWFIACWLLLWIFFAWMALRTLLWQLAGSETLRVVGAELQIATRFLFVSRVKSLPLDSIQDMNVYLERTSSKGRTFLRRFVVLHGAHGTLKLRTALEPGEGQRVVDFLRKVTS